MFLIPIMAQLAQAPLVTETSVKEQSVLGLLWNADPIVKLTLLILVGFSVICWAIIVFKYRQLKQAQADSQNFWNLFSQSKSLQETLTTSKVRSGPLYEIFSIAVQLVPQAKKRAQGAAGFLAQKMEQVHEEEIFKLEQYVGFLATTASVTPFIGLFGTVWGILTAFWSIGKSGSSSLATVGPYISEALIATAVGLAAAIPAVIAYNFFIQRIKILSKMMNLFQDDLLLKVEDER